MAENIEIQYSQKLIDELKKDSDKAKNIGSALGITSIAAAMVEAIPFVGSVTGGILGGFAATLAAHFLSKKLNEEKTIRELQNIRNQFIHDKLKLSDFEKQLEEFSKDKDVQLEMRKLRLYIDELNKEIENKK